jgi:alkylation response protein AidB-like acyl-CoA dehydrogenase
MTVTGQRVAVPTDSPQEIGRKVHEWLCSTLPPWWPHGPRASVETSWHGVFHRAGLATPGWLPEHGGLGLDNAGVEAVNQALLEFDAPVPYNLVTAHMIGAVLELIGTQEQRDRFLRPLAERREVWCQLFSEPGAGSDLASLGCRAERLGGLWVVSGQKVWSSFAGEARRGLLLARTDVHAAKHAGITAFAIDMTLPGITVVPIRQLTGDSQFCEVFFDDVHVPDCDRIGLANAGWAVAGATLIAERNLLGGKGVSPVARVGGVDIGWLIDRLTAGSQELRDAVLRTVVRDRVLSLLGARLNSDARQVPLVKLAQGEHNRAMQELAIALAGPRALAVETGDHESATVAWGFLRSRANTLAGGTSEVMRNVIGERLLGLPRETDPFHRAPWIDVPRSRSRRLIDGAP